MYTADSVFAQRGHCSKDFHFALVFMCEFLGPKAFPDHERHSERFLLPNSIFKHNRFTNFLFFPQNSPQIFWGWALHMHQISTGLCAHQTIRVLEALAAEGALTRSQDVKLRLHWVAGTVEDFSFGDSFGHCHVGGYCGCNPPLNKVPPPCSFHPRMEVHPRTLQTKRSKYKSASFLKEN